MEEISWFLGGAVVKNGYQHLEIIMRNWLRDDFVAVVVVSKLAERSSIKVMLMKACQT